MPDREDLSPYQELADEEIVDRIKSGDTAVYEVLMRRYDQRLYRVARSILRDEAEAEDVMQDTWVRAWTNLDQFRKEARFATWLTRIAVHEALARARRRKLASPLQCMTEAAGRELRLLSAQRHTPEEEAAAHERTAALTRAIDQLPSRYRTVVMLRSIEGLSVDETADILSITAVNVRVRLNRARALLRRALGPDFDYAATRPFPFDDPRCDRVVAAVFRRIAQEQEIAHGGSPARLRYS
jgi:RNA polymerase sigma-70 factor, ECF subfamily